jgi:hypothetical protein
MIENGKVMVSLPNLIPPWPPGGTHSWPRP